ncbi:MAG: minor capsid protein [Sphingorhabdus sp.]
MPVFRDAQGQTYWERTLKSFKASEVTEYEWLTSGDERVTDDCNARDGKTYSVDGSGPHPGEGDCRCVAIAKF